MPSTSDPGSRPPEIALSEQGLLRARLGSLERTLDAELPSTRLVYRINGGPPSKRLEAALEMTADGRVRHELLDEMKTPEREVTEKRIPPSEARKVLRDVLRSGLLDEPRPPVGFLPDSLVGSVTIESGDASFTHYFLAADRQRRQQNRPLSPPIKQLRPRLEKLRAELIGKRRQTTTIPK